jgi:hypothetical protein
MSNVKNILCIIFTVCDLGIIHHGGGRHHHPMPQSLPQVRRSGTRHHINCSTVTSGHGSAATISCKKIMTAPHACGMQGKQAAVTAAQHCCNLSEASYLDHVISPLRAKSSTPHSGVGSLACAAVRFEPRRCIAVYQVACSLVMLGPAACGRHTH